MKSVVYIGHRNYIGEAPNEFTHKSLDVIYDLVREVISGVVDLEKLVKGKSVVIKPNLVRPYLDLIPATITDPRVIIAVVQLSLRAGARSVFVAENPGYKFSSRAAFVSAGLDQLLPKEAKLVSLDEEPAEVVHIPNGQVLCSVKIPKIILDADVLINLAKLKTHMHTLVSLGIKNLHGLVYDEERLIYHRNDINHKLVDLLRVVYPSLTILDGIWALEGQAPLCGKPVKDMNVIIAGTDIVAVDSVGSYLMGISPFEVTAIRIAFQYNFGTANLNDIEVRGTPLNTVTRNFLRPIVSSAGVYKNINVIEGGACLGCLSALRHSLDKLSFEQKLERLPLVTIYVGKPMPNAQNLWNFKKNNKNDLWLFGNCSIELTAQENIRQASPKIVYGCAPHVYDLYNSIVEHYNFLRKSEKETVCRKGQIKEAKKI